MQKSRRISPNTLVFALSLFILLAILVLLGVQHSSASPREGVNNLRDAVIRASVQCYALEGEYPTELAYLIDHYAVTYDSTEYHVEYNPYAPNIRPTVIVTHIATMTSSAFTPFDEWGNPIE